MENEENSHVTQMIRQYNKVSTNVPLTVKWYCRQRSGQSYTKQNQLQSNVYNKSKIRKIHIQQKFSHMFDNNTNEANRLNVAAHSTSSTNLVAYASTITVANCVTRPMTVET